MWHIGTAQTEFLLGHTQNADTHIRTAHRISLAMKSQVMEWYTLLIDAWILLQEGKQTKGLLSLHRSLSLGRRHGYLHLEFYQPAVMRFLCVKELDEGIEPDYGQGLSSKPGLVRKSGV